MTIELEIFYSRRLGSCDGMLALEVGKRSDSL